MSSHKDIAIEILNEALDESGLAPAGTDEDGEPIFIGTTRQWTKFEKKAGMLLYNL